MDRDGLESTFRDLEMYCEGLGLESQGISVESIDGFDYLILNCRFGNDPLVFIGAIDQEWSYIILRYPFDIVENLAVDLRNKEDSQETLKDFEDGEYVESAKQELSNMDLDWADVKYGLAERLVSENCYFSMRDSEEVPLRSFQVEKRIFVDDNFSINQVNNAITTVVGRGAMGRLWLVNCLGKTKEIFSTAHSELEPDSSEENDLGYIG